MNTFLSWVSAAAPWGALLLWYRILRRLTSHQRTQLEAHQNHLKALDKRVDLIRARIEKEEYRRILDALHGVGVLTDEDRSEDLRHAEDKERLTREIAADELSRGPTGARHPPTPDG